MIGGLVIFAQRGTINYLFMLGQRKVIYREGPLFSCSGAQMIDPAECRDRARDCADQARTQTTQNLRSVYSNMARCWATLANQIERQIEAQASRDKD